MQPWTREKVLVEMFDILKNGRDDRLKINLLIFLEENSQFFFSTHPTVYVVPAYAPMKQVLNEMLTAHLLGDLFAFNECVLLPNIYHGL